MSQSITTQNEVQTLTSGSDNISHSIDAWNASYVWLTALALLVAMLVFLTQFIIIRKGRQLASVQGLLLAAKDRQLRQDLQEKDLKIEQLKAEGAKHQSDLEQARLRIADVNASASRANQKAAEATALAEEERLARTRLEADIAPRRLSAAQQTTIGLLLSPFKGKTVKVSSYSLDSEGAVLSKQIIATLQRAQINVIDATASIAPMGGFSLGIHVTGTNIPLAGNLRRILALDGGMLVASPDEQVPSGGAIVYGGDNKPTDAEILIGVKPLKI